MDDLDRLLAEEMKNPEFKKEWEALEPEFKIIQAMIDARKKQQLTQKELAEKTGINQADISKLETGNGNPTIALLQRLADGMDMTLKLEFVPKVN
ncbi:MAG: helix-turn-helix transcriptional regulator [Bacillota bacterium]